jgi:hypothetical protein
MLTILRRALVLGLTTAATAIGLGLTTSAHAADLSVFAFGSGDGSVAIALGPNETYDAGQGAEAVWHATNICYYAVSPMIEQFEHHDAIQCGTAVQECSRQAHAVQRSAGITFTRDRNGVQTFICWSYVYGQELLTPPQQMLADWMHPSPTEDFAVFDFVSDPGLDHPIRVSPYLAYQDAAGVTRTTHLFDDWFVGTNTKELTFRDWNGKPRVAWRQGDRFVTYNYAFAEGQPNFLNPDICVRAGLCETWQYLPIIDSTGRKLLARIA